LQNEGSDPFAKTLLPGIGYVTEAMAFCYLAREFPIPEPAPPINFVQDYFPPPPEVPEVPEPEHRRLVANDYLLTQGKVHTFNIPNPQAFQWDWEASWLNFLFLTRSFLGIQHDTKLAGKTSGNLYAYGAPRNNNPAKPWRRFVDSINDVTGFQYVFRKELVEYLEAALELRDVGAARLNFQTLATKLLYKFVVQPLAGWGVHEVNPQELELTHAQMQHFGTNDRYFKLKTNWQELRELRQWFETYWATEFGRGTSLSKYGSHGTPAITQQTDNWFRNTVQEMDTLGAYLNQHDGVKFARMQAFQLAPPQPQRVMPNPLMQGVPQPGPMIPPPAAVAFGQLPQPAGPQFVAPAPRERRKKPKKPDFIQGDDDSDDTEDEDAPLQPRLGKQRESARKPAGFSYRDPSVTSEFDSDSDSPPPQPTEESKQSEVVEPLTEMARRVTPITPDMKAAFNQAAAAAPSPPRGEPSLSLSRAPAHSRRRSVPPSLTREPSPEPGAQPGEPIRMRKEDDNGILIAVLAATVFLAIAYQLGD